MRTTDSGAVLVTGASSGLGRAAALHLAARGLRVYAGVRNDTAAGELRTAAGGGRLTALRLDVTDADSVAAARDAVASELGAGSLRGVVNNAGICVSAPVECLALEDLRQQLEVNLVGVVAVTQAFLPLLRAAAPAGGGPAGRLVNVSSGVGRVAGPFLGAYAAAQFAKEGLSDSLRRELAGTGVAVSVIEPGAIATPIWDKVAATADRVLAAAPADVAALYRAPFTRFVARNESAARSAATTPGQFARAVEHALTSPRPRTRYRVGRDAAAASLAARLLPDRLLDRVLAAG
ncbi:SDR family NAD(P)-dependent oxidoreductase [Nocardia thailandica]|uniref:SDR family NAD(P)-dependent oxidoreductase n=1 Tax=Nocardia thailandica TaxID=257275 RepID=A0ABW6PHC8_9NOCA